MPYHIRLIDECDNNIINNNPHFQTWNTYLPPKPEEDQGYTSGCILFEFIPLVGDFIRINDRMYEVIHIVHDLSLNTASKYDNYDNYYFRHYTNVMVKPMNGDEDV